MSSEIQQIRCRHEFYPRAKWCVPRARVFVRETLARWSVIDRVDDVLVCTSELVTNALVHGVPPGRGFLLHVRLDPGGVLHVEVHDSGDGHPCVVREADGDCEHGRGLRLVELLSDRWGVEERAVGKVVWCDFAMHS
jgi:anti-sigma regulatory factor (Ser/Thr protein kinase)